MFISRYIPDKLYLKLKFMQRMKKRLNLKKPRTFNEKLQWLKLYNRNPIYTTLVDKYEVKNYVSKLIGEQYVIPTLGIWNSFDEIEFDKLPNQFVLKCTHDSGGVVICKDKEKFDIEKTREKINWCMSHNFYYAFREWPYKNVPRRIIAEKYMTDGNEDLIDYKIHVFNGEPKLILICRDRFGANGITEDFYTDKWEHLDVKRPRCSTAKSRIEAPAELAEMLKIASLLAKDIPFVRTDFYIVNHQIYFGEMTFYPACGFLGFEPEEYDEIFGDWLKLPEKRKCEKKWTEK